MKLLLVFAIVFSFQSLVFSQHQSTSSAFVVMLKADFLSINLQPEKMQAHRGARYERFIYTPKTGSANLDKVLKDLGVMKSHLLGFATYYLSFHKDNDFTLAKKQLLATGIFSIVYPVDLGMAPLEKREDYAPSWLITQTPEEFLEVYVKRHKKDESLLLKENRIKLVLEYLYKTSNDKYSHHKVAFMRYYLGNLYSNQPWYERLPNNLDVAHCYMSTRNIEGKLLPYAAYELGQLYEYGRGLPQSYYLAHHYYQQGAIQGYGPCMEKIQQKESIAPDMKKNGHVIQTYYPKLTAKELIEEKNCEGKTWTMSSFGIEGKCTTEESENFPLAQACGQCFTANQVLITQELEIPAIYKSGVRCNGGREERLRYRLIPVVKNFFAITQIKETDWTNRPTHTDINEPYQFEDSKRIKEPKYLLGEEELFVFFAKYFSKPLLAKENNISGKITLSFIVEKDGSLSSFNIIDNLGYGIGDEAIRVLAHIGKWKPASRKRRSIRYQVERTFEIK